MKRNKLIALSVIFGFSSLFSVSNAQQNFVSFEGQYAPSKGNQSLQPSKYKIFSADNTKLKSFLQGLSSIPSGNQLIQLPTPEGNYRSFKIWKTSMMNEAMQLEFKDVQTYTAVALDNPLVTAKLDFTVFGFHAMVFDASHTFLIDPYTDANDGYYMAYYKQDYRRKSGNYMTCDIHGNSMTDANGNLPEQIDGTLPPLSAKQYGTTQKKYRLALSCTGEYAQAVGGATPTTNSVLSAMTTTMNRVNGIYERELGITMEFISNENALIYLNPNTDPFMSNDNGASLLNENATNTGSVIGSANYDIGHIFSTGGGGVASLGCVCRSNNNYKARGVTGSDNPVGDAYDVDYVAHEMGHQFGAEHTFNSSLSGCGSNNGVQDVAYEPGSGSTILCYAGLCGADNLQQNSDAYFHAASLDQITDYVLTQTCGASNNGVSAPDLPEIIDTFYIPITTAFELIAPLATSDSTDTITYCWEEWDLGEFGKRESRADTFVNGPCFRSFMPVGERLRVFPPIQMVIDGDFSERGIRMPTRARALDFKVTARSIYDGFGTFNMSDNELRVNVVATSGPFVITAPNLTTDSVKRGSSVNITWDVANTTAAPVSTANVDIYLSVDGGYTYPYTLVTGVPNDGSQAVTMPDIETTNARVKVKGANNVFFDISNNNFKIYGEPLGLPGVMLNNNISVYPNPAKDLIRVQNAVDAKIDLVLYNVLGQKIWSGSMKKSTEIPVGNLSRGIYYLQLNDMQSGAKTVKSISLQ